MSSSGKYEVDNSTTASCASLHEDDSDCEHSNVGHTSSLFRKAFNVTKVVDSGLELQAYGKGVEQLQQALDDTMVQWALLRLELGSGSFQRQKMLFLHLNGEDCPTVKRGRLNARTAEVQELLRGEEIFHASLVVTRAADVTSEEIMSRIGHCFVADDLGNFTARWQSRHSEPLPSEVLKSVKLAADSSRELRRNRKCPAHESTNVFESGRDALQALAQDGPWNWLLLRPDPDNLTHVVGGMGSVDEMRECLADREEDIFFGVLRLGFGVGRLRRTKFMFIRFTGCKARAISRGQACGVHPKMQKAVAELINCSASMEINGSVDLTLEEVINRLHRVVIHDDDLKGDEGALQVYCIDAFRKALDEERRAKVRRHSAPDHEVNHVAIPDKTSEETVRLSHADGAPLDWAVFSPCQAWAGGKAKRPSR
jgi:hypothetical protein|mmetsp:Transcript_49521/g.78399  ORF Transcript_49521/g.78399 Transcript_49521/m.78399 type:complete len:426 (-) Transcript_49521:232-1509(-)